MSAWSPPLWYERLAGIAWRAIAIFVSLAIVVMSVVGLSAVILPLVLGVLFACGLRPVAQWLQHRRVPAALAALASILLLLLAVGAVAWLTVQAVVDQWDDISALVDDGRAVLVDTADDNGVEPDTAADLDEQGGRAVEDVVELLFRGVAVIVPIAVSVVSILLLSLLVAFFFVKDSATIWRWTMEQLGETRPLAERIGRRVWQTLTGFVIGQTAIAATDASLITLGALVLGVPEPAAIFMLTLFGGYIPYIGAILSGTVAVLLALADGGISGGVAMALVVLAVQVFEGNVLQPWIQGRAVRLHPLVVALAVVGGGALAGILGVFLAVPITAAAVVALSELRAAGILGPASTELLDRLPLPDGPEPRDDPSP